MRTPAAHAAVASPPVARRDLDTPTDLQLVLQAAGMGGPDPFILTLRQRVKTCTPDFATAMCGCDLQPERVRDLQMFAYLREPPPHFARLGRLRIIALGACMSLDCDRCHTDVSRRRGDRIKQRLDAGRRGAPVGESVFTVPPRLRGRMVSKATWLTFRRAAWKLLQKHAGARFAVACSHPVGDKNPNLFHPHVHFLWCAGRGFQVHLSQRTIANIRRDWAQLLGARLVDFHHSYTKGDEHGKLFHRCRYIARSFPGFGKWCGQVAWFGDVPQVRFRSVKDCPKCHKPIRVIGSATAADAVAYKKGAAPPLPPWLLTHRCSLPSEKPAPGH